MKHRWKQRIVSSSCPLVLGIIDSDAEDVPEELNDEFEPAGELEVEFEDSDKTLSDSSVDLIEPSTSKRRKVCSQPKWRKKTSLMMYCQVSRLIKYVINTQS